jgi:hypothetical protein
MLMLMVKVKHHLMDTGKVLLPLALMLDQVLAQTWG